MLIYKKSLAQKLLQWYRGHARLLPWRGVADPYWIWVSEIMLQQTRVETVIPYFERWMKSFPTVRKLASAKGQDVLALWEGLGYYRRARNLHRAAKIVVRDYGGNLPASVEELRALPGIGRYTAAAIASIAFGVDVATLDGNIRRVLARVFNISEPLGASRTEKLLWKIASENLPEGNASEYNQGLMDLGALVCTVHHPQCQRCPLAPMCDAYALGTQDKLPVRIPKKKVPHFAVTAGVLSRGKRVLIGQRPENGLLGGLWEFPGGKQEPGEDLKECLQRELKEELGISVGVGDFLGKFNHAYTHFRITLYAFHGTILDGEPVAKEHKQLAWVDVDELLKYPMGKVDRKIAEKLMAQNSQRVLENLA